MRKRILCSNSRFLDKISHLREKLFKIQDVLKGGRMFHLAGKLIKLRK